MLDVFWIWHWEIQHIPFEFLMLKMFTCEVFWEISLQIQVIDNFSSSSRPRTASYTSFDSSWPSSLWTTVKILQYRNMWYTHFLSFYISPSTAWASSMLHACTLNLKFFQNILGFENPEPNIFWGEPIFLDHFIKILQKMKGNQYKVV